MISFLLALLLLRPPSPVALTVSPRNGFAPVTVSMKIMIEPHEDNREGCVVWDSESGESGSHCWPLNGLDSPRTTFFQTLLRAPDDYGIVAYVVRVRDIIIKSPQENIRVIGS